MSDIIRLLPDSVANQIAAGEVIQRPASVVKELVENAVDAGATSVQIIIKDAGRTLVQVVDNGCGMSDTDARLAFERHATSKITQAADLFALRTMGFRGEALASIAAVAQIDLRTMRKDANLGTRLIISGSKVESQIPEACVPGCNMMVKNLFFNVPARRKFLKKDAVELANIMREFERLALVNPHIDFTFISNDAILHKLLASSLKQRIIDLFGKGLDKQLVKVETDTSIVKISGFIGLPGNARRRNALQYFFVNGRNMRHPYFHKAVLHCYEQLVAPDVQPNYFLNFTVDPETIDVNIHPTKSEIKFEDEPAVWQILVAAIKETLGGCNAGSGIDFDMENAPEIPMFNPDAAASHEVEMDRNYNPFGSRTYNRVDHDWEKLYDEFTSKRDQGLAEVVGSGINNIEIHDLPDANDEDSTGASPALFDAQVAAPGCIQVKNRYLVSPVKSGLMVIDQHRAHFRILYDKYFGMAKGQGFTTQRVMFPEIITLSPSQNAVLSQIADEVAGLGFDIAFLGDNTWSINGIPAEINGLNPVDVLLRIIENVTESGESSEHRICDRMASAMARAAAIKAGQPLSQTDMDNIIAELFRLTTPNYTPDGHLIVSIITLDQLNELFA